MSAVNYAESLRRLLAHEGGYTNHAADPGGPTKFGITIHDYRMYIKKSGTAADVRGMGLDDAKKIYRAKYWDALSCDDLPPGVDYCVFDYGVNSGVSRATRILKKFPGMTPPATVKSICDERLAFLKRLKTWPTFGRGWARRVAEVRLYAMALSERGDPPARPPTINLPPDVEPLAARAAIETKPATRSTTIMGTLAAAAASVASLAPLLTDWRVVLVLAAAALGGFVIFDRWWKTNHKNISGIV